LLPITGNWQPFLIIQLTVIGSAEFNEATGILYTKRVEGKVDIQTVRPNLTLKIMSIDKFEMFSDKKYCQ